MRSRCNTAFWTRKHFEGISSTLKQIQDLEVKKKQESILSKIDEKNNTLFWTEFKKQYGLDKFAETPEEIRKAKLYEEVMEMRGYSYFLKETKTNDLSNKYSKAVAKN